MLEKRVKKVVLAYTGGLDTSIIVPWLREHYDCEVVCFTADIGQEEALDSLEEKALASGASQLIIQDMKDVFAERYLLPLLKSGAVYERKYLLGTAISRPLIAEAQVALAHEVGADAVAHGGTGMGNDQVRFELAYMALDPRLQVVAPWREWDIRSRQDAIAYASTHNVPVLATEKSIYSRDRNLWHFSHEGGPLEDTWFEPEEPMYLLTASPENAPDKPAYVDISFKAGVPVALDGKKMKPAKLIGNLNALGGLHGVGRADVVENRLVGMKSHGVYETPGGTILMRALRELEALVLDKQSMQFKDMAALKYAELVYNGLWFTPLRESLDALVDDMVKPVTGVVRLKLFKGNVVPAGRKSPNSLYRDDFANFGLGDVYEQNLSEGFTSIYGVPLKVRALNRLKESGKELPKPDYSRFKRD